MSTPEHIVLLAAYNARMNQQLYAAAATLSPAELTADRKAFFSSIAGTLNHLLAGAGNASLMTPGLRQTLCDHAAGNYRILMTLAGEMLTVAARRDLGVLDEKLYLDVLAQPDTKPQRRTAAR